MFKTILKSRPLASQNGFTMVEALMTITLVAVLGAVATTQYIDYRNDAKRAVTEKRLNELREALVGNPELIANGQFIKPGIIVDVGEVPEELSSLSTQGSYPTFDMYEKRGWRGPYVDTSVTDWNQDAWGTAFSYDDTARTITSCGPDLTCGGGNAADDISIAF